MLTCVGCGCGSEHGKGWLAFLAEDPEQDAWPEVGLYCPPCAQREHEARPRGSAYF